MRRTVWVVALLGVVGFAGCASSNKGPARNTFARLPSGAEIYSPIAEQAKAGESGDAAIMWARPGEAEKQLVTLTPTSGPAPTVDEYQSAQVHVSPDGERVWLTREGRTLASFDYASGIAIMGPDGQPTWALVQE